MVFAESVLYFLTTVLFITSGFFTGFITQLLQGWLGM